MLNSDQEFNIIAIQEPWYNKQTITVYCPIQAKYRRIFSKGRAALYIYKRHPLNTQTTAARPNQCRATLKGVIIQLIYSPIPTNQQWTSPLQALTSKEPIGPQVIVSNLNLYHLLQDREGRTTPKSSTLLRLARRWHLNLHTPQGELTRQRHNKRDLTIDYAQALVGLLVHYYRDLGFKGSNHRAQLIEVITNIGTISRQQRTIETEGQSQKRINTKLVAIKAYNLYIIDNLSTLEQLKLAVDHLTT